MDFKIRKSNLENIKEIMESGLSKHNSYFDSFLEDHIIKSNHYEILDDENNIGYFSIFEENLLTQFYMKDEYQHLSQEVFDKVRRYEQVNKAFVHTGDEFYLTHIIDYSRNIEPQAYFFKDSKIEIPKDKILSDFSYKLATEQDIDIIKKHSGDFFDDVIEQVKKKQLYMGYKNNEVVSFGIIEKSKLYNNVASIGMFTASDKRKCGIGRNTLIHLKEVCYKNNIEPIAGCWYYNHNSKKTLQSAGMIGQSRLLVAKL
ncbi:N-acetyltransferase [Sporosalibacterium faouarense]|uniref:N-acetyltransferase n=1 Tax=Sporosalibacterium faouarense TaxID=516123 RepID=UPI00141D3E4D|nr:N-acetyltransferase [Sporosalibacterium faouarense]MTI49869.1 GNAT family N-acetyltransferase [Bacillota bacterium]